jgi:F-type H+-transporting ATPase subunit epsilon
MAETGTSTIHLEIITPDVAVFNDEVESVIVRALDGDLGILPQHAPLIASLDIWPLSYTKDGSKKLVFVAGGFLEVNNNKITIVSPAAETPEQIDVERAKRAKQRAEERLNGNRDNIDVVRATLALNRAMRRIELATSKGPVGTG